MVADRLTVVTSAPWMRKADDQRPGLCAPRLLTTGFTFTGSAIYANFTLQRRRRIHRKIRISESWWDIRRGRAKIPRVIPFMRRVVPHRPAPRLPARHGQVHLHFHGASAEDIAEALRQAHGGPR